MGDVEVSLDVTKYHVNDKIIQACIFLPCTAEGIVDSTQYPTILSALTHCSGSRWNNSANLFNTHVFLPLSAERHQGAKMTALWTV